MDVILDVNVIISAVLSRNGAPALVLRAWHEGRFELIVSPLLLGELERALGYPKLRRRIPSEDADALINHLRHAATAMPDPDAPPSTRSLDPGDDYLLALAAAANALLVSGDEHLLVLREQLPIHSPSSFLALLEASGR